MFKKAHKSSQHVAPQKKTSVECSVCKSCSTKTVFYVCDSGHVVCENCHQSDGAERRQDSGDCVPENICSKHTKKTKIVPSKSSCALTKDLASGDHDKRSKTPNKETKSKSECKINMSKDHIETKSTSKIDGTEEVETIIAFKNVNYKSSTYSLNSSSSLDIELITELPKLPDSHVCPRWYQYLILELTGPVQCPVEACNKMIALDSVMLHFYFDHSKVPRMTLYASAARQLQLKPSNLSSESQCLGIFLLQENKGVSFSPKAGTGEVYRSDCKSVLLLGAKIQMEKLRHRNEKSCTTRVLVHNVCTQTELLRNDLIKKNSNISIKKCESYRSIAQNVFDDDDILLLWLCKQDDNTDSYSISVLRKDKKQGFNYIGEAIHIRNEQSPAQMFHRADCLMVPGTALNRLLDEKNQISVLVNVLE